MRETVEEHVAPGCNISCPTGLQHFMPHRVATFHVAPSCDMSNIAPVATFHVAPGCDMSNIAPGCNIHVTPGCNMVYCTANLSGGVAA
jgi:hypothetical protein